MKYKKILLPIVCLMFFAMVGMVHAEVTTCVFSSPGASDTLSGTDVLNITCSGGGDNASNCSVTASSSASGGSFSVILYNSTLLHEVNATVNTKTSGRDAADWSFSGSCRNGSNDALTLTTRSGVTINNGEPTVSSCTIDGSTGANGTIDESSWALVCTVQNATACNLYWKDTTAHAFASTSQSGLDYQLDAITFSSTYGTGTTLTANLKQAGDEEKTAYMDCTDGTDTTTGTNYEVSTAGSTAIQDIIDEGGFISANIIQNLAKYKIIALFGLLLLGGIIIFFVTILNKK